MEVQPAKLHLGCFDQVVDGWLNTDITPHIFIARVPGLAWTLFHLGVMDRKRYDQHRSGIFRKVVYLNVTKRFPYADESFHFVYSSHLLEHLDFSSAQFCVREIYRVLKPGGIVRIAVPDLDKLVQSYEPQRPEQFLETFFESNQGRSKNRHHWHYNFISLGRLLAINGFREINKCEPGTGRCPDLALLDIRPESLFVEAMK